MAVVRDVLCIPGLIVAPMVDEKTVHGARRRDSRAVCKRGNASIHWVSIKGLRLTLGSLGGGEDVPEAADAVLPL